jgi:hypothetical protein
LCAQRGARKGFSLMMTNFGFQPGILDYWMLLTDWRNGSFAILLALGILLVGHAVALRNNRQAPSNSELGPLRALEITMGCDASSTRRRETTKTEM